MSNAVEEALNRANAEQRDRAMATIDEARRTLHAANVQLYYDPSGDAAATIARQEQIIDEAERNIPAETMKSVDEIGPPMNTPPMHGEVNSTVINLNPTFKSNIESIEQNGGNNYLNQNAMDRALDRPSNDNLQQEPQQKEMGR